MGQSKLGKQWGAVLSWLALISSMYAPAALGTLVYMYPKVSPMIVVSECISTTNTRTIHRGKSISKILVGWDQFRAIYRIHRWQCGGIWFHLLHMYIGNIPYSKDKLCTLNAWRLTTSHIWLY